MNRNIVALLTLTAALFVSSGAVYAQAPAPQPPAVVLTASADDIFNAGVDLQTARQYAQAIGKYTEAIAKRKVFTDAYLNRGICYIEIGEIDKARADFEFYIKRKPNVSEGYISRAAAYWKKKEHEKALGELKTASEKNPRSPERAAILYIRAAIYHDRGEYDRAISEYTEYMAQATTAGRPIEPEAYKNRASAYRMRARALEKLGAAAESHAAEQAAQRDLAEYAKSNS
jgi:tetratricopeptide (TPR) repeat protein